MTNVEAMATSVAVPHADLSILGLIMGADIVVKLVLLILAMASVWSWAIIIDKSLLLRKVAKKIDEFEAVFWSRQLLDQLYDRMRHKADNPLAVVFVTAMDEWSKQRLSNRNQASLSYLSVGLKDRIIQAMGVARNKEIEILDKNTAFLAVVGSSSTFIGLFGTVWGIMSSFRSIAAAQNASISVVAPGIAEALFATAIGLVAAIPAVIFYSLLSNRINNIDAKVDDFSNELGSLLSQEIDRGMDNGGYSNQ
jgi:biopolymer transport protein TolQ